MQQAMGEGQIARHGDVQVPVFQPDRPGPGGEPILKGFWVEGVGALQPQWRCQVEDDCVSRMDLHHPARIAVADRSLAFRNDLSDFMLCGLTLREGAHGQLLSVDP